MQVTKFSLPNFILVISSIAQAGARFDEHHRALDAADECVAATIKLIDPDEDVGGFWFFHQYINLNSLVCNAATFVCDYNATDYERQAISDCKNIKGTNVSGKIVKYDIRICGSDIGQVSSLPDLAADFDFINVAFCLAQSCADDVQIVPLHRALWKLGKQQMPNPYGGYEATSKGLCLDPATFAPTVAPPPTDAPAPADSGGHAAAAAGSLSLIGIVASLLTSQLGF